MTKLVLLANERAGTGEAAEVANELRRLGADVDPERPDRFVVAGGDGTIAPAAVAAARAGVPLAVIAAGTANDFARRLGLPTEREAACALAVSGRGTRSLDIGRMDRRPFVNVASVGLPPLAASRAKGLKRAIGSAAYLVGALRAGFSARPVRCSLSSDGLPLFAGEAWQVTIGCTGAFGAGSAIDADPADGRLDAVVVEARSRLRLPIVAYGLRTASLERRRGVRSWTAQSFQLEVPEGTPFNVDGEIVEGGPARFSVEARAFRVIVPEG